jgi:hypothetical protein
MILPFSTKINGKETFFVEKIWKGIITKGVEMPVADYLQSFNTLNEKQLSLLNKLNPKLHTIREDKKNRWKTGIMIDFFINVRQKTMFRFAPTVPVASAQKIEIVYYTDREVLIKNLPPKIAVVIDDEKQLKEHEILKLAQNDGFDTVEDFFEYFNQDYTGKIIHWTDLRY